MRQTGVYAIRRIATGMIYVGSASNSIACRWKYHRLRLKAGKHDNSYLQASWNKYGEAAFEFVVLEECQPDDCLVREQHWIDHNRAAERAFGYNLYPIAGSPRGTRRTESQRRAQSERQKGKRRSEVARAAIAAGHRGKKLSKATCEAMSRAMKGRVINEEWRKKIAEAGRGRKHSEETRRKIGAAHKGKKVGEATRRKISVAHTGKKLANEYRKAMSDRLRRHLSEAQRKALTEGRRKRWPRGAAAGPLLAFMEDTG